MSTENLCGICLNDYNKLNPPVPVHKAINNEFHFVCYECFLRLNNICPYCKSESDLIINPILQLNIYNACLNENYDLALELLNKKKYDKIDFVDNKGNTALILACQYGLSYIALELIKTGLSKPDQINNYGDTALLWACKKSLLEVALELIKTGQSKPEQTNNYNKTALILARKNNLTEVVSELEKIFQIS